MIRMLACGCILGITLTNGSFAEEPESAGPAGDTSAAALRAAIERAVPLIEKASAGSADQRKCFTCHNQALPILALAHVRSRGIAIDETNFQRQVKHTFEHLERGKKQYLEGKGQGGRVITAGYALWALSAADWPHDEVTSAVTNYLLGYQQDRNHWSHPGNRPPTSGSDFTTSYVALRGLSDFATEKQQAPLEKRREQLRTWLAETEPRDTEDRVFRVWILAALGDQPQLLRQATDELRKQQNDDGGWSQNDELDSDAYATASVLAALSRAAAVPSTDQDYQRGLQYLLKSQLPDGSWHVITRADPFQTYYETGFPHGEDQFVSVSASSWAVIALAQALPEATDADRE